jgi:hypothetical protein
MAACVAAAKYTHAHALPSACAVVPPTARRERRAPDQPHLRASIEESRASRSHTSGGYFAHPGSKGSTERDRWDHWTSADQNP